MKYLKQFVYIAVLGLSLFSTQSILAEEIVMDGEPMDYLGDDAGCDSPQEFFHYCNEGRGFSKKVIMYKDGQLFAKAKFKNKKIKVAIYIPKVQHKKTRGRVSGIGDYSEATFKLMMKFLAKPHKVYPLDRKEQIGNHIPVEIENSRGESLYDLIMRVQNMEIRHQ